MNFEYWSLAHYICEFFFSQICLYIWKVKNILLNLHELWLIKPEFCLIIDNKLNFDLLKHTILVFVLAFVDTFCRHFSFKKIASIYPAMKVTLSSSNI
jgi:hypothetical protein